MTHFTFSTAIGEGQLDTPKFKLQDMTTINMRKHALCFAKFQCYNFLDMSNKAYIFLAPFTTDAKENCQVLLSESRPYTERNNVSIVRKHRMT